MAVRALELVEDYPRQYCACGCGEECGVTANRARWWRSQGLSWGQVAKQLGCRADAARTAARTHVRYARGHGGRANSWRAQRCLVCGNIARRTGIASEFCAGARWGPCSFARDHYKSSIQSGLSHHDALSRALTAAEAARLYLRRSGECVPMPATTLIATPRSASGVRELLESQEMRTFIDHLEATHRTGRRGVSKRVLVGMCLVKEVFTLASWTDAIKAVTGDDDLSQLLGEIPSPYSCYRFSSRMQRLPLTDRTALDLARWFAAENAFLALVESQERDAMCSRVLSVSRETIAHRIKSNKPLSADGIGFNLLWPRVTADEWIAQAVARELVNTSDPHLRNIVRALHLGADLSPNEQEALRAAYQAAEARRLRLASIPGTREHDFTDARYEGKAVATRPEERPQLTPVVAGGKDGRGGVNHGLGKGRNRGSARTRQYRGVGHKPGRYEGQKQIAEDRALRRVRVKP